jgi:prolyl oligopeptidase
MPDSRLLAGLTLLSLLGAAAAAGAAPAGYPAARRTTTTDTYHGTTVADPYRWLEDAQASDTQAWVTEQNKLTRRHLDGDPGRAALKARLTRLWNYVRVSTPTLRGEHLFFSRNDGLQNQAPLYHQVGATGKPAMILDPNQLSKDGTVALTLESYSPDGRYLAYGLSRGGSDKQEVRIRDLHTGKDLPETLHWCRFTSIAWRADRQSFYYNRFPAPGSVAAADESNYNRVYAHTLGRPQGEDPLVLEKADDKELMLSPVTSEDGRYLWIYLSRGTSPDNRLYVRRDDGKAPWIKLVDKETAEHSPIGTIGDTLYVKTNADAPRGRIVAIDLRQADFPRWHTVLPQGKDFIDEAIIAGGHLVVTSRRDAQSVMAIHTLDGKKVRDVALPTLGTVTGLSGEGQRSTLYFGFTSFLFPLTQYRYDLVTGKMAHWAGAKPPIDTSAYVTEQVFVPAKDGTKVPVFLVQRKGLKRDGSNPVQLYGYGGFNVSLTPSYSASRLVWLEKGGIYALANLRGGGEYGEAWHQAGMLDRKQTVFDDFQATAAWLIDQKYTRPAKLAIMGGSNGGLLVAASIVQRPDLFGAAICQVPVTDMLRYHRFTVGRYWIPEYGNAETDAALFPVLRGYSPLHNVQPGVAYPATLITTADTDDRVVPAHAFKFAATLQTASDGPAPILLRVETQAGHGAGKPTAKLIEEVADVDTFLFQHLGMK